VTQAAGHGSLRFDDLLRVAALLRPDPVTLEKIASMLGVGDARRKEAGESESVAHLEPVDEPIFPPPIEPSVEAASASSTDVRAEEAIDDREDELDVEVIRRDRVPPSVPEWLRAAKPLRTGSSSEASGLAASLPPLFTPRRSRAILTSFIAMPGEGDVDTGSLIERVARGEPIRELPRRIRPTLGRGVRVLVDRSDAMMPFLGDIAGLTADLNRVAGLGQELQSFVGSPMRGCGVGSPRRWRPFGQDESRPLPGSRVVCITDLGLGRGGLGSIPVSRQEWLEFAESVRRLGCSPCAIVPYEPTEWPRSLARAIDLLFWDPSTRASDAIRSLLRRRPR
jgi:hypothetical protein